MKKNKITAQETDPEQVFIDHHLQESQKELLHKNMTQELGDDNIKNFDGISDTIAHERNLHELSEDQKANKEDPIKAQSP